MAYPVHAYRPQRTPPKVLEAIFVAREPLLQEVLERLNRWTPGASRQHYLFIGPRGIGKTYLLQLIQHRVRITTSLQTMWYPVAIAEDAYSITRVTDLLIQALEILCQTTADPDLERLYQRVVFDDDEARVTDLALDGFRAFHQSRGGGVLLMVENVNRLLERQIRYESEVHLLRKLLIEEDWLMMIGTSPTHLSAVTEPEKPLFEFFQVKLLAELTPDEQQEMLYKLAALEHDPEVEEELHRFRSRLRALYHFTGGNPRLTVMLYDLVAHQHIKDVKTELDFLLDQLTPFYQSRMNELPDQEGKLLEVMALMTEGCTPTELAHEARMAPKLVRGLMTRLERSGYIRREQRRKKRTVYIMPERFFRLWHQMNHSRTARGRIQYLLEFFSTWYATKAERDQIWKALLEKFDNGTEAEALEPLLDCLQDYYQDVRISTVAALGAIASEKSMADVSRLIDFLIDESSTMPLRIMLCTFLKSVFRSADLDMIGKALDIIMSRLREASIWGQPYIVAFEYLRSGRKPAVLEQQHPEMREATQLLIDVFDE